LKEPLFFFTALQPVRQFVRLGLSSVKKVIKPNSRFSEIGEVFYQKAYRVVKKVVGVRVRTYADTFAAIGSCITPVSKALFLIDLPAHDSVDHLFVFS
jgi:hypothetical protein